MRARGKLPVSLMVEIPNRVLERFFNFHRPETLQEWFSKFNSLRKRMQSIPRLSHQGLRDCQIKAVESLEGSYKKNHPRALIQMRPVQVKPSRPSLQFTV